jgi:hypothetical protein
MRKKSVYLRNHRRKTQCGIAREARAAVLRIVMLVIRAVVGSVISRSRITEQTRDPVATGNVGAWLQPEQFLLPKRRYAVPHLNSI